MARTHGTTSWAERTQPQGRSTESLYYLIANRWRGSANGHKQGLYLLSPPFFIIILKQRIAAPLTLVYGHQPKSPIDPCRLIPSEASQTRHSSFQAPHTIREAQVPRPAVRVILTPFPL